MYTFDWDPLKANQNANKHGIAFVEAASVFYDPLAGTAVDVEHNDDEDRFVTIEMSKKNNLLVVVHCFRSDIIRIIGARRATTNERRNYEEQPSPR